MVMRMNMAVLWDLAMCSLINTEQCFRGTYCFYHQGDKGNEHSQCVYTHAIDYVKQ
jgi:hypothetical protein